MHVIHRFSANNMLLILPGKLNDVKAVNLDNILWKFPEYGFSKKIRNPIRSFHSTNIGQQLRVMRKKGRENIHKRNKKKNVEVLFVRNAAEKCDPKDSKKPTSTRPWSFDDAFGFRSHQGRNLSCVYHQRAGIGRKKLNKKRSDLKPCRSCINCAEDTPNKFTISEDCNERKLNQCENFARDSSKRASGKETLRSMETPVKTSIDTDKASAKQNTIENTSIQKRFNVGCGDGGFLQEFQTYCTGTKPDFREYEYDVTKHAYNKQLRYSRYQERNKLSTLLRYILRSLITIVWSPCIIAFLVFWFITYPLRPQPVYAPWQSEDNRKGLSFMFPKWLNSEIWPITTFKNLCAIKSKPKFNHSHDPNLEEKYLLYHKSGKRSVIKPTPERIICHQPQIRDKRQTHFLYNHKNRNKISRVKEWRSESTAKFGSDTGRSTHRSQISKRACHENFPLATTQHEQTVMRLVCKTANESLHLHKTVGFPHAFGNSPVTFKDQSVASSMNMCPASYKYQLHECIRPREPCPAKKPPKRKKRRKSCVTKLAPTRCGLPPIYSLVKQPCGIIRRQCLKYKVKNRCTSIQTSCIKRSSSRCRRCFGSFKNSIRSKPCRNVSPCGSQTKMRLYKNACEDCMPVPTRGKIKKSCRHDQCKIVRSCVCPRHERPKKKKKCGKWCRPEPCKQSSCQRFKSLFTSKCQTQFHSKTLNRNLTTLRPYHIFFGPGKVGFFRQILSTCWSIYKGFFHVCLVACAFVVWGPVFLIVYLLYTCFSCCM